MTPSDHSTHIRQQLKHERKPTGRRKLTKNPHFKTYGTLNMGSIPTASQGFQHTPITMKHQPQCNKSTTRHHKPGGVETTRLGPCVWCSTPAGPPVDDILVGALTFRASSDFLVPTEPHDRLLWGKPLEWWSSQIVKPWLVVPSLIHRMRPYRPTKRY